MTTTTRGAMYEWVARHTSEVEPEVIEFRGSTLDLLRVAAEQDAIQRELVEACKGAYPMLVLAAYEANKRGDSDARARTSAAAEKVIAAFGRAKGEA